MEEQRNKVIGLIGTSECVGKYITTKLSSGYADYFIINTQSMLPDNESVLECMRKWSEQYSQHKFNDDDLLTFLSIAELDDKINETVRSLSVGEQKRLHFLKALLVNRYYHIVNNLFDGANEKDIEILTKMIVELSTYANIILTSESDTGFAICDKIVVLN